MKTGCTCLRHTYTLCRIADVPAYVISFTLAVGLECRTGLLLRRSKDRL